MGGKYIKKNTKRNKGKIRRNLLAVVLILLLLIGVVVVTALANHDRGTASDLPVQEIVNPTGTVSNTEAVGSASEEPETSETVADADFLQLGNGLEITRIFPYTGAFMEDRTDDVVTDVLALIVTNNGDDYIQTMDLTLYGGDVEAHFTLSTLFPGESVVVLELNRMAYSTAPVFTDNQTSAVALFDGHPGMCEDQLDIQCLNGVINVTNISGEDIPGDILIYYKNYSSGYYYGGITYRFRIEGGIKAGEIKQGTAAHFNVNSSAVVFVTCE